MKLNLDCVRDVLIEMESFPLGCYNVTSFTNIIPKHSWDDINYTLYKLAEAGFIIATYELRPDGQVRINVVYDITFKGHEFLAGIKSQDIWSRISETIKQGGAASLQVISKVAVELGVEVFKKKLGLFT